MGGEAGGGGGGESISGTWYPSGYLLPMFVVVCGECITRMFILFYFLFIYSLQSSKPKKTRDAKLHESFVDIEQQLDKITGI